MGATQPLLTREPREKERRGREKRCCSPSRNTSTSEEEAAEADRAALLEAGLNDTEAVCVESSRRATTVDGLLAEKWPLTLNVRPSSYAIGNEEKDGCNTE